MGPIGPILSGGEWLRGGIAVPLRDTDPRFLPFRGLKSTATLLDRYAVIWRLTSDL